MGGTLPRAMLSLLMSVSGGISWIELITPLSDLGWHPVFIFLVYLLFTLFAVLNVITGFICESAIESARQDSELVVSHQIEHRDQLMSRARSLFQMIDSDGSSYISYPEMEVHLQSAQAHALFAAMEIDIEDVWQLFKLLDADCGVFLDLEEFVTGCMRLR